jgi:citrate lyase subunit beta/citryl-CoA lyase
VTEPFPRSFLFVPADRPKLVESALRSDAEAIVFDLEDAVAPDRKQVARESVREILDRPRQGGMPLFVRVNADDTPEAPFDVRAVAGSAAAGLVIPKAESADRIRRIAADAGGLPLVLLLETPRGVLRAADLADAAGRALVALAFGAEDFRAAMGVETLEAGTLLGFALSSVAVAAAAANVPAIDAPEMSIGDRQRLRARAVLARDAGFRAKFAIHPAQLATIHDVFAPTAEQRTWAERVTRVYEEGSAQGLGSVRVDDRLVDAATVRHARGILERCRT